jgi:CheY-like chemotaxis protein
MPPDDRPVILVIDDSAEFRNLLREALTREGYDVVEAADGQEGLRLFDECRPDLVLLDIIMPEKDGIETLREMLRSGLPGLRKSIAWERSVRPDAPLNPNALSR